jgi:hypothetical protein
MIAQSGALQIGETHAASGRKRRAQRFRNFRQRDVDLIEPVGDAVDRLDAIDVARNRRIARNRSDRTSPAEANETTLKYMGTARLDMWR